MFRVAWEKIKKKKKSTVVELIATEHILYNAGRLRDLHRTSHRRIAASVRARRVVQTTHEREDYRCRCYYYFISLYHRVTVFSLPRSQKARAGPPFVRRLAVGGRHRSCDPG